MIYNIHDFTWDRELLELFEIPLSILPKVCSSSEIYGNTNLKEVGYEVPIAGIAGDQQAALFGQLCVKKGMVKNTYGTGCFVMMNTGTVPMESNHLLLTTIAWKLNGVTTYALEGSVFIAGALIQWLRDQLGIIKSAPEVEELAKSVNDNGDVYIVPAFAGLGAPHWDQNARGTIIGLTRGSGRGHIARAALEAIAFQSYDVIQSMLKDSGIEPTELRVDGGASANDLLMQIQANLIGFQVVRPVITETTAMGAAYLAGLAVQYWENIESLATHWKSSKSFEPTESEAELDEMLKKWNEALNRSKNWTT
jgi:glycerol kinase